MWSIIFRKFKQFKIRNIAQMFSMMAPLPVIILDHRDVVFFLEYLVLVFTCILFILFPGEVPETLYLCPLSKDRRRQYVVIAFWIRIAIGNIIHMCVLTGLVLTGNLMIVFAGLILILFVLCSIMIGMTTFLYSYTVSSEWCKFVVLIELMLSVMLMLFLVEGTQLGYNIRTIVGIPAILFTAWYVNWLLSHYYKKMVEICSDYESSSQRMYPYGRRVKKIRS